MTDGGRVRSRTVLALAGLFLSACARTMQVPRETAVAGFEEPARMVRAKGWAFEHEVRVWLPPSYRTSDRTYPTLWVTDNDLELARAALLGTELIIVSVGAPRGTDPVEFQRRRRYDFIPARSLMGPTYAPFSEGEVGGAPGFLDFLVNQLRPMLAKEYRMDPNDHAYAGHSGGGMFGLYALFSQPESFARYLVSSPATSQPWLDMEEAWFRQHKDLKARVFLSAGEAEASDPAIAPFQVFSTVALVGERLTSRKYPSLELAVRIFPGKDHLTVMPVAYAQGIRYLWAR